MTILKIYDEKTRMYPSGKIATAEVVYGDYPAMQYFTHVIGTDENDEVIFSINNLSSLRTQYQIDPALSEEEAVQAIQDIMNAPPEEVENVGPTPEERTAAALEAIASGTTAEQQLQNDEAIAELTELVASLMPEEPDTEEGGEENV